MNFKLPTEGGGNRPPQSNQELLEQSRLSRLPRLPERKAFVLPDFDNTSSKATVSAVCAGCDGKLDLDDSIQKRFNSCRKCVSIFGRVGAAVEETEKRDRQTVLKKMAGGANR